MPEGGANGTSGRLAGMVGLVTGAASGLGREVTLAAVREGASVVVFDVDRERGDEVVATATGQGRCMFFPGDVTREQDLVDAIALAHTTFGRFDFLHNNAGIQGSARFHETDNELWDRVNDVNLRAVYLGCKHAISVMRETGGGSIVSTASILAHTGDPYLPAYTATKTAVLGLTRALAAGYAADGIRCNCVCPGDMDTPMNREYFESLPHPEEERAAVEGFYPMKRFAHPAEVAAAVIFLLSDEASFITGTSLVVDGGLLAKPY